MRALNIREVDETPLQIKLDELAENIGKLGLIAAILIFIILTLKYFIVGGMSFVISNF